jgi:hypothetical protein
MIATLNEVVAHGRRGVDTKDGCYSGSDVSSRNAQRNCQWSADQCQA